MAFESLADVDNWLALPGQTIGVLRGRVTSGTFQGQNARWAKAWLEQYDAMSEAGRRDREVAIQQQALDLARATAAEQLSVAKRAAGAAEKSARWAGISAGIAIAALAIAGWPQISEWFK